LKALCQERLQATITLSIKETPVADQRRIIEMSSKEIAIRLLRTIYLEKYTADTNEDDYKVIQGIYKLSGALRIQFANKDELKAIHNNPWEIDWNKAFNVESGIHIHVPMYCIVIHGVPSDVLSTTALSDAITAREIELQNNILRGTITKIPTLQRRGHEEKLRSHYSIVIHLKQSG